MTVLVSKEKAAWYWPGGKEATGGEHGLGLAQMPGGEVHGVLGGEALEKPADVEGEIGAVGNEGESRGRHQDQRGKRRVQVGNRMPVESGLSKRVQSGVYRRGGVRGREVCLMVCDIDEE